MDDWNTFSFPFGAFRPNFHKRTVCFRKCNHFFFPQSSLLNESAVWAWDLSRHRCSCRGARGHQLGPQKVAEVWGNPLISGKSRLVKCYNLARMMYWYSYIQLKGEVLYVHSFIESRHNYDLHSVGNRLMDGGIDWGNGSMYVLVCLYPSIYQHICASTMTSQMPLAIGLGGG